MLTEPEPQLLFDGRLVLTSGPKKPKHRIDDIATWMEAFSTFTLILTSHFPRRWRDFCQYQLLILRTYRQFASRVWLAYDRTFCQHAAATHYIFNAVAEAVEWILLNSYNVPDLLHYPDDFITAGPSDSPQCALNLGTALAVCKKLGLPLHPGKCVGPSPLLTVLGIELDSLSQVARLRADKLYALKEFICSWLPRKWCNRHELESDWPPAPCCQSCVARKNLLAVHD